MKEYNFYEYYEDDDKIKIYGDDIHNYFEYNYNIIVDSIDFDTHQNVILYIEDVKNITSSLLEKEVLNTIEKELLNNIEHLNDVEIKSTKIILTFDANKIELC